VASLVDVAQRVNVVVGVLIDNLDQQLGAKPVRRLELLLNQQRFFLVCLYGFRFEI